MLEIRPRKNGHIGPIAQSCQDKDIDEGNEKDNIEDRAIVQNIAIVRRSGHEFFETERFHIDDKRMILYIL